MTQTVFSTEKIYSEKDKLNGQLSSEQQEWMNEDYKYLTYDEMRARIYKL